MKTDCIRCQKEFEQVSHPAAHFFTICHECRKQSPETLLDQQDFNRKIENAYLLCLEKIFPLIGKPKNEWLL